MTNGEHISTDDSGEVREARESQEGAGNLLIVFVVHVTSST